MMSKSANRLVSTILGAIYLLIGILGFAVTTGVGFFSTHGGLLFGIFGMDPMLEIVHLLVGCALLIAGLSGTRRAKTVNTIVGAVCLVLGIGGLLVVNTGILALNAPDHALHLASAAVLLAAGLGADRTARRAVA
jgi:hypothetical protein